ncbi:hypothetical protein FKW77_010712 [Venturia effusa]|uniref:Uncharacterized protein n=1 Tax=Venturia effusa TaxID=50376 RepID=A0A517KY88_9PEZI|nr:hypothetical protein FKW77_010712 [Venturia effusa]
MEQDNITSKLCAEVDRILNSPYPVALKTLDDILCLDTDGRGFRLYAASNPCKVRRLAKEVYDAIELWPYVTGILEQLCAEPTFRRCILQDYPILLDSLLQKAVSSYSQGFHQYHEICLQLLCEPLPISVSLPASAEQFFVGVVDQAIRSPAATTLCRVYDLLTGACQALPQILPQDTWAQLEHGLVNIVGNAKTIQDQSVSLTCFGIIYALATASGPSRGRTHSQPVHSELTSDLARTFFSGRKAEKSLNLAALQAAWSCKASVGLSFNQVLRSLDIVSNIFSVVDAKVRSVWSKTNDGQANVSRLMSKAMEEGLDIELRIRLFAILGTVVDPEKMPTEMLAAADRVLLLSRSRWSGVQRARHLNVLFLEGFAPQISHKAWTKLLRDMLGLATYAQAKVPVPELLGMCLLSQTIGDCLTQMPSLRKALSSAFAALQDEFVLQDFLKKVLRPVACGTDEICSATALEARRALGSSIASLYVGTALSSGSEMKSDMGKHSLRMLSKLQQLAGSNFSCNVTYSPSHTIMNAFIEAKCTPDVVDDPRDWKGRISTYTRMDAKHQEISLVRLVGEICQDLEDRCVTTEEPLRQEQEKTKRIQEELATLLQENNMLKDKYTESSMHVESLEIQKSEIEACLLEEQSQSERLFTRVDALERDLDKIREASEEKLRQLQESCNEKEMELMASLSALRCASEDLKEDLDESRRQTEELEQNWRASKEEIQSLHASLDSRNARLADVEGNLESVNCSLRETQAQLETQTSQYQEIEAELRTVEDKKEQVISELSNLRQQHQDMLSQSNQQRSALQDEIDRTKQQLETAVSSHNLAIEELSKHAALQEESYNAIIRELRAELETAEGQNEGLRTKLEEEQANLAEHQQEIQRLVDAVAERDSEIQGYQALRQTLVTAIDAANTAGRKHVRKSVHYQPEPAETQRTPVSRRRSRRTTTDAKPHFYPLNQTPEPEGGNSLDATPEIDGSFESASSRGGPTPKRARQHKASRSSAFRQPRTSIGLAKTVDTQKRAPFLDISTGRGNSYPRRPATSEKKAKQGKMVFDEENLEVEFGSLLFESTPFTPGPGARVRDDDFFGDTTVDE